MSRTRYTWFAASYVAIGVDVIVNGFHYQDIFLAGMSLVFAYLMFRAKRIEEFAITRYRERHGDNDKEFASRMATVRLGTNGLWPLWATLVLASIAFRLTGNMQWSNALVYALLVVALCAIPARAFLVMATFK